MRKITNHVWYDTQAVEAAHFYVESFGEGSNILSQSQLENTPSGTVDIVTINLLGEEFTMISAGPYFKFTPAISFMVLCASAAEVDLLWNKLSAGGSPLMPLQEYPFSPRYGWIQDRYGLSWQIGYMPGIKTSQRIQPSLLFVGTQYGKAEEAMKFYTKVFRNASIGDISRYEAGEGEHDRPGTVKYGEFTLEGQRFAAMDSGYPHAFTFNEAVSFMVHCKDQAEIDYYWEKLSAVPDSEQCGWLKDTYGVSWQIVPERMDEMMEKGSKEQVNRVTEAFLKMKKFDLAELERVYRGK